MLNQDKCGLRSPLDQEGQESAAGVAILRSPRAYWRYRDPRIPPALPGRFPNKCHSPLAFQLN